MIEINALRAEVEQLRAETAELQTKRANLRFAVTVEQRVNRLLTLQVKQLTIERDAAVSELAAAKEFMARQRKDLDAMQAEIERIPQAFMAGANSAYNDLKARPAGKAWQDRMLRIREAWLAEQEPH